MINIEELSIKKAREALKNGTFSARELVEACLKNIEEKDGELHAFLEVYDDVLEQADEADKKIKEGEDKLLLGIPIAIKDNILMKGKRATAGSRILEGFVATEDSTVVRKLKEAGAVIVGRTNMDEFAMGSSTENSAYGVTKNPHDLERVAGGSSGGSAAAVASGMVLGSYGSETGGSIRQPASLCGIVGLKTTYGRVSRSGLIALASSLDQVGPFGKTLEDTRLLYEAIKGPDPMDSTTISDDTYPQAAFSKVVGVPRDFVEGEGISEGVKKNFDSAVERFKSLGYAVKDVELPHIQYSLAAYYIILPAEASANLARFDGVRYGLRVDGENGIDDYFQTRGRGFGQEVRRRILLGTYVLSSGYYDAYYGSAVVMKNIITRELESAFRDVDLILTPTTPGAAFKVGEKSSPLAMYLEDIFTVPANIAGMPAISLPYGHSVVAGKSLPLGIELTAGHGGEEVLFQAGKEFLGE